MQGGLRLRIPCLNIGAVFQQHRRMFRAAECAGQMQGRKAGNRLVDIHAGEKQLLQHLRMGLAERGPERIDAAGGGNSGIRAMCQQKTYHRGLSLTTGMDQRR